MAAFPTNPTVLYTTGALSGSWSAFFGDPIATGGAPGVKSTTSGGWNSMLWNPATFDRAATIEMYMQLAVIPGAGTNINVDIVQGTLSAPNGYTMDYSAGGAWVLHKSTAGSFSTLTSGSITALANNDWVGIRITPTAVEGWYKAGAGAWTMAGTSADTTFTGSFNLALEIFSTSATIANISGGNAISTFPKLRMINQAVNMASTY